ncbi:hypothetical protein OG883_31930 [Streptomyces sp. NBC_01142]|uniref:hypothetical protein n=1 Tax=Streptomyces sp. NBC_01142 TaxID=2975865 RepID=UPI00225AD183|nr:hypothetical protein [Streptomyces sp. NBC_01142]MCX4824385.1 hypothetical protein [Streptomyces sp. NBC_01142]
MTDGLNQEAPGQLSHSAGSCSLRLLPWQTPEGKPCYLSPDSDGGVLSRLADTMEAAQTNTAADVLKAAKAVLDDSHAGNPELRLALSRVNDALADVLRVAQSRGARLPASDDEEPADEGEGNGPRLPAEAFG